MPRPPRQQKNTIRVWYRYTVQGSGTFPLDMLRYDVCWPSTQDDVINIDPRMGTEFHKIRRISVTSIRLPSNNRWASFGWTVHDQTFVPA